MAAKPRKGHCLVIGAGVAGLVAARRLAPLFETTTVVERAGRVGGRWLTATDDATGLRYDLGAYRLHATHARLRALCRELGVAVVPWRAVGAPPTSPGPLDTRDGTRAAWDAMALARGAPAADAADLATGYAGALDAARVERDNDEDGWGVPLGGFGPLAERLAERAQASGVRVLTQQAVLRLWEGGAHILDRATGRARDVAFDWCVATAPPDALAALGWQPARALRAALQTHDATRVFARVSGLPPPPPGKLRKVFLPGHPCQQVMDLPPLQGGGVANGSDLQLLQASYGRGRRARLLRDANPAALRAVLTDGVRRAFDTPSAEVQEVAALRYWEASVHSWRPLPGGTPLPAVVVRPGGPFSHIVVCGEAYSRDRQGWAEGALETAADAVAVVLASRLAAGGPDALPAYGATRPPPFAYVVVDGRVLDVEPWFAAHPGGAQALRNHLGEDVTALFDVLHAHSERAHGVVLSLQRGWWLGPAPPTEAARVGGSAASKRS